MALAGEYRWRHLHAAMTDRQTHSVVTAHHKLQVVSIIGYKMNSFLFLKYTVG